MPTALAGIYGMNFENMGELKSPFGYHGVVTTMALIRFVLYSRFRKNGWL